VGWIVLVNGDGIPLILHVGTDQAAKEPVSFAVDGRGWGDWRGGKAEHRQWRQVAGGATISSVEEGRPSPCSFEEAEGQKRAYQAIRGKDSDRRGAWATDAKE
jgi:hypothetical protein